MALFYRILIFTEPVYGLCTMLFYKIQICRVYSRCVRQEMCERKDVN